MKQIENICGTTVGLQSQNGNMFAINLLGNLDIIEILEETIGKDESIKTEWSKLKQHMSKKQFTCCYKSYIGENISFRSNTFEDTNPCNSQS